MTEARADAAAAARRLAEALLTRRETLAVAESLTGGLMCDLLTDVPGVSAALMLGVVCYSNASKVDLLGVPSEMIAAHGAVSEPVARALAEGVRARGGTHYGVATTGIAGPTGATATKPVGTVFTAWASGRATRATRHAFRGSREEIKVQSAQAAFRALVEALGG